MWGYSEVRTYECPRHGPVFVSPQTSTEHARSNQAGKSDDSGDRDLLISARRKPTPMLNAGAIALPEPESD